MVKKNLKRQNYCDKLGMPGYSVSNVSSTRKLNETKKHLTDKNWSEEGEENERKSF